MTPFEALPRRQQLVLRRSEAAHRQLSLESFTSAPGEAAEHEAHLREVGRRSLLGLFMLGSEPVWV